jgi:SAM-dependent methyltransferase
VGADIYTDGRYLRSNPGYHVADSAWKASQVLRAIQQHRLIPTSIAEIGCGAGEVIRCLRDALPNVQRLEGWDVSRDAIKLALSRADARLKFYEGDLLAESPRGLDLVLCLDVIEHVDDYLGFLRRLKLVANRFIFHIPLDVSVQSVIRVKPIVEARAQVGHLHYFVKDTALASLTTAGYVVDGWCYTAGSLDLPDKSVLQRLARMPRRIGMRLAPDLTVRVFGGFSILVLAH